MATGSQVVSVVEGEMTQRLGERWTTYRAGESFINPPGVTHSYGNEGPTRARTVQTIISRPGGGPPTTVAPAPPAPPGAQYRPIVIFVAPGLPLLQPPPLVDVVGQSGELDPGFVSSTQVANGFSVITIISGVITLRYQDGQVQHLGPGRPFSIAPGRPVTIANEGLVKASYLASWLVAPGTPLISPAPSVPTAPAPAAALPEIVPPRTGDGGLASSSSVDRPRLAYLALATGFGAVILLGRRRARSTTYRR